MILFLLIDSFSYGQQADSLSFEEQFAQLEAEMDSLSIFFLLDSMMNNLSMPRYSELNIRTSYNSNLTSAGRNYDFNQQNVSPGLSFYHSSGAFIDYSGFWNSGISPRYNLSVFTLGYMGRINQRWNFSSSYERWWYHGEHSNPLNNVLGNTITYSRKIGYASLDYSVLFGDELAHRLIGSVTGIIDLHKWWIFESIKLLPSGTMIFGNADITTRYDGSLIDALRSDSYVRDNLDSREFIQYVNSVLTEEEKALRRQIIENRSLSRRERRERLTLLYFSNPDVYGYVNDLLSTTENQYGIMNYSFSLPLYLSTKSFNFIFNYTYSIPVSLPGEQFEMDPIGFFGASVIYRIPFNNK